MSERFVRSYGSGIRLGEGRSSENPCMGYRTPSGSEQDNGATSPIEIRSRLNLQITV